MEATIYYFRKRTSGIEGGTDTAAGNQQIPPLVVSILRLTQWKLLYISGSPCTSGVEGGTDTAAITMQISLLVVSVLHLTQWKLQFQEAHASHAYKMDLKY